jgi:hypothetical protein
VGTSNCILCPYSTPELTSPGLAQLLQEASWAAGAFCLLLLGHWSPQLPGQKNQFLSCASFPCSGYMHVTKLCKLTGLVV